MTLWKSFGCPSFLKPNTLLCPRWCMEVRNGFLGQSDSLVKVQAQVFTSPFPLLLCVPEDFMFYPSGCGKMSQTHSPVHWCCTNFGEHAAPLHLPELGGSVGVTQEWGWKTFGLHQSSSVLVWSGGSATHVCLQTWGCRSLGLDPVSSSCANLIIHLINIERGKGWPWCEGFALFRVQKVAYRENEK